MVRALTTPALVALAVFAAPVCAQSLESLTPQLDAAFEDYVRAQHVPGLVWGIVKDGELAHVKTIGVQDLESGTPVTPDSRFRIASMSKAFTALTILSLRDEGRLRLDDLAQTHVPEMQGWTYPTSDSPKIRVRDLLHHVGGLVEDDPWGDRQTSLPEADFTAMLAAGVPFSRVPQDRQEYSNFGYATLGRIIGNVSGKPFEQAVADRLFQPLGMASTGYDVFASPQGERALGYRFEEGAYKREPDMAAGAFGAMGGIETTARNYARYVGWLLSAWPARDGAETGPVRRSSVRGLVQGLNFVRFGARRADLGPPCAQAVAYAMGFRMISDCDVGDYMTHTGGYPGYGSVLIMLPESGIGVFAFANRTYSAPMAPAYGAVKALKQAGLAAPRPVPLSLAVAKAYADTAKIWAASDILVARPNLAMNMLLDRAAPEWRLELTRLKAALGDCTPSATPEPTGMLTARFSWPCARGTLAGSFMLAPTNPPSLQQLRFRAE
jgi:CubicO group peptidase (beta-lactamase class C family)